MTTTDEALVEVVARALAKSQGLDFDEVCGVDADPDEGYCDSGTCISAYWEEHDAEQARRWYTHMARAAIAAMPPAPQWRTIDSVPEGHVVLVCDTKNNRWTDMVSDGDGTDTCGFPLAYWIPLPTPPAGAV